MNKNKNVNLTLTIKNEEIDLPNLNSKVTSKILGINLTDYLNEDGSIETYKEVSLNTEEKEFVQIYDRLNEYGLKYSVKKETLDNDLVKGIIKLSRLVAYSKESREMYGEDAVFSFKIEF